MITPLPPAPSRGDDSDVFVARADAHITALARWTSEVNVLGEIFNLSAANATLGYLPPVEYAAGLLMKIATQTVQYGDNTYAPILLKLPFTTSGTFEADKFRLIQGLTSADLALPTGAAGVGYGTRTVDAALREFPSVVDHGAVAGAALDNTAAIAACEADTATDTFHVPPGYFNTSAKKLLKRYIGPGYVRTGWIDTNFGTAYPVLKENSWHPDQVFTADRPVLFLPPAIRAAYNKGSLLGVIAGDSISEVCDSFYGNGVAAMVQTMMAKRMPFCKIRVLNMSLLGRALDNLSSPAFVAGDPATTGQNDGGSFWRDAFPHRGGGSESIGTDSNLRNDVWPNGTVTGKSWLAHVRDAQPDFIVIAHGTNAYGGNEVSWIAHMKSIWTSVQAWEKVPFLVLVPPSIPSIIQASGVIPVTQAIADAARAMALQYGWGLIDVNALSRVVLTGTHTDNAQRLRERNFNGWANAALWNVGTGMMYAKTSSSAGYTCTVTATGANSYSTRRIKSADVDISATFTLAVAGTIAFLVARSPSESETGGLLVRLEAMGATLRVYSGTTQLLSIATGLTVPVGGAVRLRVRPTGGYLEIWVNNSKLVDGYGYAPSFWAGAVGFGYAAGNGVVSEFEFEYTPDLVLSTPIVDEYLVFGGTPGLVGGTIGFREESGFHGGDGIHHPSGDGLQRLYTPAVGRFVSEFVEALRRPVPAVATQFSAQTTTNAAASIPIAGTTVSVMSPAPANAVPAKCEITISFPYTNTEAGGGAVLSLYSGTETAPGATLRAWYLDGSTAYRKNIFTRVLLDIGAGPISFHLQWQGAALTAGSGVYPIEVAATILS
ncbi:hypothetical protein [Janthinobacterium sp. MDB2-8]|uniref:hypothetical protein n=1 Tax=Janthinobacterium sp. MDB2-8 TaxID=1259338 RepID=UPI003F1F017B